MVKIRTLRRFESGSLKSMKLVNFKCHRETPEIEITPITLLVGPNNSGKTAVIQPLLMLKQTLEPRAPLVTPIILVGDYVEIGTFYDAIYNHDLQKSLEIIFSIQVPLKIIPVPRHIKQYTKKRNIKELKLVYSIKIGYSKKQKRMILSEMKLSCEVFKFYLYPTKSMLEIEFLGKKFGRIKEIRLPEQNLKSLINEIPILVRKFLGKEKKRRLELESLENYFFIRGIIEVLLSTVKQIEYIGPIRQYPLRYYVSSGEKVSSVGITGEDAIEVLQQDKILKGQLTEKLNTWLRRLKLAQAVEIKEIDPHLFSLEIVSPFTRTKVNSTSIGFGVSQIIPVIIQAFLMPQNSTLILEQPEIHLHPSAQAVLADLLIHLAKKGKKFLVETHSEHLILRLQRRVAEKKIESDKIRIYYFDLKKTGVTIRPVKIDSKGELLNFPSGFMEEGLEDAYRIAIASSSEE